MYFTISRTYRVLPGMMYLSELAFPAFVSLSQFCLLKVLSIIIVLLLLLLFIDKIPG